MCCTSLQLMSYTPQTVNLYWLAKRKTVCHYKCLRISFGILCRDCKQAVWICSWKSEEESLALTAEPTIFERRIWNQIYLSDSGFALHWTTALVPFMCFIAASMLIFACPFELLQHFQADDRNNCSRHQFGRLRKKFKQLPPLPPPPPPP